MRLIVPKAPFSAKEAKKSKHLRVTRGASDIMNYDNEEFG